MIGIYFGQIPFESDKVFAQDNDYKAAARLAFDLKQPGRLLAVVNKAASTGRSEMGGILGALVSGFGQEELQRSLEYIREW